MNLEYSNKSLVYKDFVVVRLRLVQYGNSSMSRINVVLENAYNLDGKHVIAANVTIVK